MKIVAIGGGNYSLDDESKPYNVEEINKRIVELANKKHPRLLNIGFNVRSDYYYSFIKKIFSNLGCQCEYLRFNEFDNTKTVESKFKRADIIFLPGGNTLNYMKQIRKFGLDKYIEDSARRGIVLAGISAGAIMCFDAGCSDSRKNESEQGKYLKVKGLGLQRGLIAPHYTNSGRPNDLPRMLKSCKKNTVAFGIDECAALVIRDETYQLVKSSSEARVFKCYYLNGEYKSVELENEGEISELYCLN